jgi:hypothetical protein
VSPQAALNLVSQHKTIADAARASGMVRQRLSELFEKAKALGLKPTAGDAPLLQQISFLKDELRRAQQSAVTHETVRSEIINLKAAVTELAPIDWVLAPRGAASSPGVPTLFLSDLHWGEVVDPRQINGVNEYNLEIAHRRMDAVIESAVHLLKILDPQMRYPGIVLPLGGDMISGDIHEELEVSNEIPTIPTVIDLYGKLRSVIGFAADTFRRVFVPCVTGNHGRNTMKMRAKDRHHTSFDWMLYTLLAKHFENDKRVTFYIPDGPDAFYRIYEHKYLLTHGDQFRGGDGIIGALGPLTRGNQKKHSRNSQIDMAYDTMICGHWHQDIFLRRLIVNGSTKGYDEYAYAGNFGFEPPSQQLWVTHPKYRITYRMPVQAERQKAPLKTEWVSLPKAA